MPSNSVGEQVTSQIHDEGPAHSDFFSVFFRSLLAMAPWPLLAISVGILTRTFEQSSDIMLLFGGVTMVFSLPLILFDPPEWVFFAITTIVWILVLFLPALFVWSRNRRKVRFALAYVFQAGFSISQAGLGLLMILGRSV